jgi:hypothetical protein
MALSRRVRLRTALRSGFAVEVRGAKAGARLMVVARYRGRLVARGRATASPAGSATVKLRFTAAGKARLKGVRRAALRLSGPAAVTVTLRR